MGRMIRDSNPSSGNKSPFFETSPPVLGSDQPTGQAVQGFSPGDKAGGP